MPKSTKRALVFALIELLRSKPLDEVTVKELTDRCGISRQAFYYHFSDIYGVVDWGLRQELRQLEAAENSQALQQDAMKRLMENKTVVLNAYRAFERSYVEHYLSKWVRPLIAQEVERQSAGYSVTEEQTEFVAELYTMGFVSVILGWLDRGMPGYMLDRLHDFRVLVSGGSMGWALKRLAEEARQS